MIKAVCTSGDDIDVLVVLDNHNFILFKDPVMKDIYSHGVVNEGVIELSADEAILLGYQLITSGNQANDFRTDLRKYNTKEEDKT